MIGGKQVEDVRKVDGGRCIVDGRRWTIDDEQVTVGY